MRSLIVLFHYWLYDSVPWEAQGLHTIVVSPTQCEIGTLQVASGIARDLHVYLKKGLDQLSELTLELATPVNHDASKES